jgi:hypothetical protein
LERERSDDNDARALFLSNTAEERVEALDIISDRFKFCHQCKDHHGVDLISDLLPFGRFW